MSTTRSIRAMNIAVVAIALECRQAARMVVSDHAESTTPRPPLADGASLFLTNRF
ncbi:hypothetical protein ACGTNG_00505 [Halomonas sp. 1390]|uniref:hypothetical protein n=1 Tax=Halomonas sp. B23F22_3 TaxID=3459516 RepID=UPI00373E91F1